jgi:RNA polymerase sigma factor (sigma-70 family)
MSGLDNDTIGHLMVAAAAGDRAAYRAVLEEVERWSTRFFRHRAMPSAINDLVQETLIAVHSKRHTYDPALPFGPWLAAIARYKWADYLREIYRRAETRLSTDLIAEEMDDSFVRDLSLRSLLARLKPAQATVIMLVKLQGYSVQEAALETGQSEILVRVNIHRGLKQLIEFVEN